MSSPVDEDIVFLNPSTDSYVALDAIGRRIWELLEVPQTLGAIIERLTAEFAAEPHQIAADVESFLEELVREDMVRVRR